MSTITSRVCENPDCGWRDKALRLAALLGEIDALDDGDERFAWKHEDLFNRIHAEIQSGC